MRHTAVYLRVSSDRQELRSQEPDLQRWLAAYAGDDTPVRWYAEKRSGKSVRGREEWQKVEAALRAGEVERVVVWRLDRLGRSTAELAVLMEEMIRLDVPLVSVREGFDLRTPAGRLMANVLASIAMYERESMLERQAAGIAAAKAAGKRWGGRRKGARWRVTPDVERQVRRLYEAGEPKAAIARAMRLSRTTVYGILTP